VRALAAAKAAAPLAGVASWRPARRDSGQHVMGRKADTMLRLWAPCGAGQQGTALYMSAACSLSARTAARRGCAGAAMHASRAGGGVAPPGAYSQQASQRAWHRPCPRPRQSASRRAQRVAVATLGVRGARSGVHARGEAGGDRVGRREHRHQPARVRRCGQQAAPHPPDHRAAVVGGQGARGACALHFLVRYGVCLLQCSRRAWLCR